MVSAANTEVGPEDVLAIVTLPRDGAIMLRSSGRPYTSARGEPSAAVLCWGRETGRDGGVWARYGPVVWLNPAGERDRRYLLTPRPHPR